MEREDTTAHQPQVKNESIPSSSRCARRLNRVSSVCSDCSHGSRTPGAARRCQEFRSEGAKTSLGSILSVALSKYINKNPSGEGNQGSEAQQRGQRVDFLVGCPR